MEDEILKGFKREERDGTDTPLISFFFHAKI